MDFRALSSEEIGQHVKELDIFGYTVIKNLIPSQFFLDLKNAVIDHYEKQNVTIDHNKTAKMVFNLQNKDKKFVDLLTIEPIQDILKEKLNDPWYQVLPPSTPNYILGYFNARSSIEPLALHNDSYIPNPGPSCWMMQATFLLDKFTVENGCTIVVPGSHQSGKYSDRTLPDDVCKPILGNPGDVVLWDSRTWHGALKNVSGEDRWAIIATLSQWWIKPSMDMTRSLPQEIYEKLSDEQKRLLGFCSIPPRDETDRIVTKQSYKDLKPKVTDYYH